MFDNPKRNLKTLEEELRAVEEEYQDQEDQEQQEEDVPYIPSRVSKRKVKESYRRNNAQLQKTRKKEKAEKKKNRTPVGAQYLLAILEILAIILIVRWWLAWMN